MDFMPVPQTLNSTSPGILCRALKTGKKNVHKVGQKRVSQIIYIYFLHKVIQ